jgi:hypothetical protein
MFLIGSDIKKQKNYYQMKIKDAKEITGGLSNPSKMPGRAYSIPASRCNVGSKLAKVKGSVCEGCYALKGMYRFGNVQSALEKRYQSLADVRWVNSMALLISNQSKDFFRWHDSGDIQSIDHLHKIVQVCKLTPNTKHWLPTREYKLVEQYIDQYGSLPSNLVVRLSAHKVDFAPPAKLAKRLGVQTSSVVTSKDFTCPSSKQGNKCLECRACWDKSISNVSYSKH